MISATLAASSSRTLKLTVKFWRRRPDTAFSTEPDRCRTINFQFATRFSGTIKAKGCLEPSRSNASMPSGEDTFVSSPPGEMTVGPSSGKDGCIPECRPLEQVCDNIASGWSRIGDGNGLINDL